METGTKLSFPFQYWKSTGINRSFLQLTGKETACLKQATDDSDDSTHTQGRDRRVGRLLLPLLPWRSLKLHGGQSLLPLLLLLLLLLMPPLLLVHRKHSLDLWKLKVAVATPRKLLLVMLLGEEVLHQGYLLLLLLLLLCRRLLGGSLLEPL